MRDDPRKHFDEFGYYSAVMKATLGYTMYTAPAGQLIPLFAAFAAAGIDKNELSIFMMIFGVIHLVALRFAPIMPRIVCMILASSFWFFMAGLAHAMHNHSLAMPIFATNAIFCGLSFVRLILARRHSQ